VTSRTAGDALVVVALAVTDANHHQRLSTLGVPVAHLQLGDPSLTTTLDMLADSGAERITLVGFSATPQPPRSWIRRVAAHWLREREVSRRPSISIAKGVLSQADPAALEELARSAGQISTDAAPLQSPAWERPPPFRRHVLVCRGPRCSAQGGDQVAAALADHLESARVDEDEALVTQTGCLYPCNQAPVICVHPGPVWLNRMHPDSVGASVLSVVRST